MNTQLESARKGTLTSEIKASPEEKQTCTMCGDFCAMKKGMEIFETDIREKR